MTNVNETPFINANDEPPALNQTANAWHYVQSGEKRGPVSEAAIREMLERKEVQPDTQVWRKGMTQWISLRESDLGELVASEPPSLAPSTIGNGYVWVLALLPLLYGVVDASIAASNHKALVWSHIAGAPYRPSANLSWQIPTFINALLGFLDNQRLNKAGYGTFATRAMAIFLTPIYLFVRAKKLKQTPWYGITWIVTMIIGFILIASVTP